MNRIIKHTAFAAFLSLMVACNPIERIPSDENAPLNNKDLGVINASAVIGSHDDADDKPYTKAMVNIYSAQSVKANFLKIDEDVIFTQNSSDPIGAYTFKSNQAGLKDSTVYYPNAYIVNGSLTSAADNTKYHLRDVIFRPDQSYRLRLKYEKDGDETRIDTLLFNHTRMIGWSPMTKSVPAQGATMLSTYSDEGIYEYNSQTEETSIVISDIDLSKDVMFTDLREAQHWHAKRTGEQRYRVPFGYNTSSPKYSNFFTFKHYRSAVRIYASAEQSQQNLSMWGQITGVKLSKQPTKCVAVLPNKINEFPTTVTWSEPMDQDIITEGMFGDDPNYSEYNITAEYPISMTGATSTNQVYLGWAMVEPGKDVVVDLHTTSGVYQVTIPFNKDDYPDGKYTENLFQASKFYTINLNLQTTGAIAEILEFQSSEHYFDLTKLSSMDNNEQEEDHIFGYRYSNCYIVDTQSQDVKSGLSDLNRKLGLIGTADEIKAYDGYAFSAIHIGNGDAGIIPTRNANVYFDKSGNPTSSIDPASARLVWESSKGLISNVELIHTYVRFKIDPKANLTTAERLKGNAVIAVYDKDENLLWSWHIWVTDTPHDQTIGDISFMDRNLGATASMTSLTDASNALDTYGLYYQWGRKDPSMGPQSYNYSIACLNTAAYYDYASDKQTSAMTKTESNPTVMTGVKYPMYLVLPSVNKDNNWLGETFTDLWGYDGTRTNKSVYDPCPYGYRVPGEELNAVVTETNGSHETFGYKVGNDFYLPYAGFKGDDKGSITTNLAWAVGSEGTGNNLSANVTSIGEMGDYQSSVLDISSGSQQYNRRRVFVNKHTSGFQFWIGSQQNKYTERRIVDFTNRRNASSVRCVKDENMGYLTADLHVSGENGSPLMKPGRVILLDYKALSSGSALSSVTLDLQFSVETQQAGGGTKTETATQRLYAMGTGSPKVSDDGTIRFTVQDEEFLSKIKSNYRFILTAKNEAGRTVTVVREIGTKDPRIELNKPYPYPYLTVKATGSLIATAIDADQSAVRFVSSDPTLLTVDKNGNLTNTGKRSGVVTVTAYIDGYPEVKATCQVVVLKPVRPTYWVKATSVDELEGKTVVIFKNNDMFKNSEAKVETKTFNAKTEDYPGNTFTIEKSGSQYIIRSTANNKNTLNIKHDSRWEYTLRISNNNNNNTWNITEYNNSDSYRIQNANYTEKWCWVGENDHWLQLSDTGWGTCTFEIWYQVPPRDYEYDDKVYSIKQNGYDKYVYDNENSSLVLSTNGTTPSYQHHWVQVTENGNIYAQNVVTGRFITATNVAQNNIVTGSFDKAIALQLVQVNANNRTYNINCTKNNNTYQLNNWGGITRDNTRLGWYGTLQNNSQIFVLTQVQDYQ